MHDDATGDCQPLLRGCLADGSSPLQLHSFTVATVLTDLQVARNKSRLPSADRLAGPALRCLHRLTSGSGSLP